MMLGGMEPKSEKKKIGTTADPELLARIEKLEKELQWHRWALIFLVLFTMYQNSKNK